MLYVLLYCTLVGGSAMNQAEKEVLNGALEALNRLQGAQAHHEIGRTDDHGEIELQNIRFPIAVKRNVNQIPAAMLAAVMDQFPQSRVLVTEYVNPKLADALRVAGQEFMDTAGNAYVNRPGYFVLVAGQRANWNRGGAYIDTHVAFEPAGLKVTYGLLVTPDLVNKPYRTIAEVTGAAVGTVGRVIKGLEHGRYLTPKTKMQGGARELRNQKHLFHRWVEAYGAKLALKTNLGTYYIERDALDHNVDLSQYHALWGGETAAEKYTDYLRPQEHMLYLPKATLPAFLKDFRARKYDPLISEVRYQAVRLKEKFWKLEGEQEFVNPILVYADLLATDDARNIDTAGVLYERYILPRFE